MTKYDYTPYIKTLKDKARICGEVRGGGLCDLAVMIEQHLKKGDFREARRVCRTYEDRLRECRVEAQRRVDFLPEQDEAAIKNALEMIRRQLDLEKAESSEKADPDGA